MKKSYLRALAAEAEQHRYEAASQSQALAEEVRRLKAELEVVKTNWRPVPMVHEWQPKNPQCALCDDPRDAARHQVGQVSVS